MKENIKNGLKYLPILIIVLIIIILSKGNEDKKLLEENAKENQTNDIIFPSLLPNKENISMKKMLGKKYVLQFFATWCGYCREEYDAFLKMETKIPVYGIENGRELLKIKANPFVNIGVDPYGSISQVFNISVIPQTFVIDEEGKIIFHRVGAFDVKYLLKFF
jgi:cytochrome c biogenesis protein CcmG/thiol:disulfide interchange protein DsbE